MAGSQDAYDEVLDNAWAADVAKLGWKRSSQFPGLVLQGACPHCNHPGGIDVFVADSGVTFVKGQKPEERPRELVECTCTVKHDGAPDKPRSGCGRWGYVEVTLHAE